MAENDHLPLTWHIALTTVYALTCYTVKNMQSENTPSLAEVQISTLVNVQIYVCLDGNALKANKVELVLTFAAVFAVMQLVRRQ